MSKALILVDTGDRQLDDVKVSYWVEDRNTNKGILIEFDCPVIPLPSIKTNIDENKDYPLNDDFVFSQEEFEDIIENHRIDGWNQCVEQLLEKLEGEE